MKVSSAAMPRLALLAALAASVAGVARAVPLKLPNFPIAGTEAVKESVALADLNGDKTPEIIATAGSKLVVYSSDGKPFGKFPVDLGQISKHPELVVVGAPAVGDLDGDGKPDICLALSYGDEAGALIAVHADGKPLWTTPVTLPKGPGAGCSIGTIKGKGVAFVGTKGGSLVAVTGRGSPLPGFPARLGTALTSTVSVGRFSPDDKPVIAVGAEDGQVFVVDSGGKQVDGFPLKTSYEVSGAPAFGDIDEDGQNELVVASQDFKVYVVKGDGSAVQGFPAAAEFRIYGGVALGDLLHEGHQDIVAASGDGKVWAWNNKGRPMKGFPVVTGKGHGSVVVADSHRDGKDDIFFSAADGSVYGFNGAGHKLEGYPLRLGAEVTATPALGDVDLDPAIEMIVPDTEGKIHGYKLERNGTLPLTPLDWPAAGHDAARTGTFGPNPARYAALEADPKVAHAGEAIQLSYKFWDLDGDPEPATRIRWTLDDKPMPDLDQKREVPADRVRKAQHWRASIQSPDDFNLYQSGPLSTVLKSNEVVVADTPPTAAKVTIVPNPARTTDTLTAKITTPSTDADGDAITYQYLWQRNGKVGSTDASVPPGVAKRGEHWRVLVTPTDGEKAGATSDADIIIQNTPPTAPEFSMGPASPTTETDIKVTIQKPATDADADTISYRHQFYVNGEPLALDPSRPFLPRGAAHKGDTVKAEVWAFDGEAVGPRVSAQIQVVDAAPEAPKVAISPETPHTGNALTSGLIAGARDPDHDPVTYRISWTKGGQSAGMAGNAGIAGADVHKGDVWAVSYVPNDGTLDGPPGTAQVTVVNTPPTKPRLSLSDTTPAMSDTVKVFIAEPSKDIDDDAIHYEYKWTVEDPKSGKGAKPLDNRTDRTGLAPGEFHKHQRILATVTAIDSDGARSQPAVAEIVPSNTPPTAPVITLSPAEATTETGLTATLTKPAVDVDRDTITYHYKWYRDGVYASDIGDRSSLKPGEIKRGEQWRVVVRANDGEEDGPAIEEVANVHNVPPVAPVLVISPAHPTTVTGLTCQIATPAKDADGDSITLHYTWFRDGQQFPMHESASSIPPGVARRGENWKCQVVARDELSSSTVAVAAATVVNAAPTPPKATVQPSASRAGEALTCAIDTESIDPDGDRVQYKYQWTAPKGVKMPKLEDPSRIPPGVTKKGQLWSCTVIATDGQNSAVPVASTETVGNTPPGAAELAVEPWGATPGQDLTCNLVKPAADVDGDEVKYAYTWMKNGDRQSFATTSSGVPGRLVKPGDRWSCSATANDGEDDGPSATSADMVVAQTADEE